MNPRSLPSRLSYEETSYKKLSLEPLATDFISGSSWTEDFYPNTRYFFPPTTRTLLAVPPAYWPLFGPNGGVAQCPYNTVTLDGAGVVSSGADQSIALIDDNSNGVDGTPVTGYVEFVGSGSSPWSFEIEFLGSDGSVWVGSCSGSGAESYSQAVLFNNITLSSGTPKGLVYVPNYQITYTNLGGSSLGLNGIWIIYSMEVISGPGSRPRLPGASLSVAGRFIPPSRSNVY